MSTPFLWGCSTSSHQVEGFNTLNDWWPAETNGSLPFESGAACDQYRLYARDLDLARDLGHTAHRFSVEWSRVQPRAGAWDTGAIDHYRRVVDAVRDRNMEPLVTLHHFTNPGWFSNQGGWLHADSPALFEEYAARIFSALDGVSYWLTINEPTVYVMQAYVNGEWPPFATSAMGAWRVLRNLASGHRRAYRAGKAVSSRFQISFAHNAPIIEPCRPDSHADAVAVRARDYVLNRLFFRLIGTQPADRPLDYVALNYYTRTVVRSEGSLLNRLFGKSCSENHHRNQGQRSQIGWEVYPAGLRQVLNRFAGFELPIMVTENGIATDDEAEREQFIRDHVTELLSARQSGLPIIGYLYWSLLDNFEWHHGFKARFGLAAVDWESQRRVQRPAARLLTELLEAREHHEGSRCFDGISRGTDGLFL